VPYFKAFSRHSPGETESNRSRGSR